MKNSLKALWLVLAFVALIFSVSTLAIQTDKAYNDQTRQLMQIQTQLNALSAQQDKLRSILEDVQKGVNGVQGSASFYDYRTSGGWTSLGHRVCASRDMKRGTTVTVTSVLTGKSVDCLVTDYGPDRAKFPGRIVDMSSYAFSMIADKGLGIIQVTVKTK